MSVKVKQALLRLGKVLGASVVAALAAWVVSPDVANIVGTQYAVILGLVATPLLSALEKFFSGPTVKVANLPDITPILPAPLAVEPVPATPVAPTVPTVL